jgi:hypothetical protein
MNNLYEIYLQFQQYNSTNSKCEYCPKRPNILSFIFLVIYAPDEFYFLYCRIVLWKSTNVSEGHIASICRVEE